MKNYKVTNQITGDNFFLAARNEWSAVRKAIVAAGGEIKKGEKITWHGTHAALFTPAGFVGRWSKPQEIQ